LFRLQKTTLEKRSHRFWRQKQAICRALSLLGQKGAELFSLPMLSRVDNLAAAGADRIGQANLSDRAWSAPSAQAYSKPVVV
jgi:hypothetical protein